MKITQANNVKRLSMLSIRVGNNEEGKNNFISFSFCKKRSVNWRRNCHSIGLDLVPLCYCAFEDQIADKKENKVIERKVIWLSFVLSFFPSFFLFFFVFYKLFFFQNSFFISFTV